MKRSRRSPKGYFFKAEAANVRSIGNTSMPSIDQERPLDQPEDAGQEEDGTKAGEMHAQGILEDPEEMIAIPLEPCSSDRGGKGANSFTQNAVNAPLAA